MGTSFERTTATTDGFLLSAIASVNIPESVGRITIDDYRELRESYAGIRETFKEYIAHVSMIQRLPRIGDAQEFVNALYDIAQSVKKEGDKYQKTALGRKVAKYGLFTICHLLPVAAAIYNRDYGLAVTLEAAIVKLVAKVLINEHPAPAPEKAVQMLANMRKRILQISTVKDLSETEDRPGN